MVRELVCRAQHAGLDDVQPVRGVELAPQDMAGGQCHTLEVGLEGPEFVHVDFAVGREDAGERVLRLEGWVGRGGVVPVELCGDCSIPNVLQVAVPG